MTRNSIIELGAIVTMVVGFTIYMTTINAKTEDNTDDIEVIDTRQATMAEVVEKLSAIHIADDVKKETIMKLCKLKKLKPEDCDDI